MRYKKLRSLCNLQNLYRLHKEQEEGEDTGLGKVGLEMCREIPVGCWDAAAIPVQWEVQETSSWLRSSGWGGAVVVKGLRQPARAGQQKYTTSIFTGCLPWRSPWQQQGLHIYKVHSTEDGVDRQEDQKCWDWEGAVSLLRWIPKSIDEKQI